MNFQDISVLSKGSHAVRVTYVQKVKDTTMQAFILRDVSSDIVLLDSATVEDTETRTNEAESSDTETRVAELHKCTDEFRRAEDEYYKQHNDVERGSVESDLPK